MQLEMETLEKCREVLAQKGITNRMCELVLFDMVLYGHDYDEAAENAVDWLCSQLELNAAAVDKTAAVDKVFAMMAEEARGAN